MGIGRIQSALTSVAFLAAACASPADAAPTASGIASATVVTPLSLVNTADLSFGSIIPSASAGTVTVDPYTEARTASGGAVLAGGAVSAGKFLGLTSDKSHLKIDVPKGSITITCAANGATMTVTNFQINGDKNDWVTSAAIFTVQVGATLNVAPNQPAGAYQGTFDVTVNYR